MTIPDKKLERLVEHFCKHWRVRCNGDSRRFRGMPNLETAIQFAARSETADGRIESHQRRIGRVTLRRFERKLQRNRKRIRGSRSFHDLYALIHELRIDGIGELAVYDISQRIGEYLRLHPKEVFLHAGTKRGARLLGHPGKRLRVADLPQPLRKLKPDQIESFLCLYKGCFAGRGSMPTPRGSGGCNSSGPNGC